jgi:hypothetical protein
LRHDKGIIMENALKTLGILAALAATTVTFPRLAAAGPALKPFPAGIVDLPASISASNPIGPLYAHPWQNVNVDGMRIRTGWKDIETQDGVYNWKLIDDCLARAATSGKFIGLSVTAGIKSPPWLMGADTFTDGSTTLNVAGLYSPTARFVAADVGRVIDCDKFPPGTTIISRTTSVATLSAPATATKSGNLTFSILARHPGVPFRVLTAPDSGVMPVPWDPVVLTKWEAFVAALGARYDGNAKLLYVPMGGFSQTIESYLATQQADVDYFNASAVAAGYTATVDFSAGMVAWQAVTKEIIDTYMTAFPTTPPFITVAKPFPKSEGIKAVNAIVAWAVAKYPGRFGIMNSQLHATSVPGYFANAAIYNNWLTQPTGVQFLCSSGNAGNVARLSNSPPWGSAPLLSPYDAMNNSLTAALNIGCRYVETYEVDVINPAYQTMLATQGAALKSK